MAVQKNQTLSGIHAISEALRAGRAIERITVVRSTKNPRLQKIIAAARRIGVPVRYETRKILDQIACDDKHQGIVAVTKATVYRRLKDFLPALQGPSLLVVLDGVEDPRNLGAIIRSAHASGADALIVAERRSAPLSKTVSKAAAGALEYLPIVRVKNINRSLTALKQAGFWVFGLAENGSQNYDQVDLATSVALVLGGEGKGLHRITAEHCDALLRIPTSGPIASLNVSVAAGIVLFEAAKQRRHVTPKGKVL